MERDRTPTTSEDAVWYSRPAIGAINPAGRDRLQGWFHGRAAADRCSIACARVRLPERALVVKEFKNRSRKLARESYWEAHDRDTYECPDCGRGEDEIKGRFEVHHKNGEPLDNRPENRVALCRVCHNLREDKKPSIKQIENLRDSLDEDSRLEEDSPLPDGVNRIYTAGSMHYNDNNESTWRASVQDLRSTPAEIVSPKDVTYDHGGDLVAGVAGHDLKLLDSCDAVVAYFDKEEQVGTLTELMYAVSEGKPALVLFHEDLIDGAAAEPIVNFPIAQAKIEGSIEMRFESPVYWFLINTLLGDSNGRVDGKSWNGVGDAVEVRVVCSEEAIKPAFNSWQKEWVGDTEPNHLEDNSNRDEEPESSDTDPRRVNDVSKCPICNAPLNEYVVYRTEDGKFAGCGYCWAGGTVPTQASLETVAENTPELPDSAID